MKTDISSLAIQAIHETGGHQEEDQIENRILAGIPAQELEAIRPYLEDYEFPTMEVLNEPDQPVANAYFLNSGLASLEVPNSEGTSIEVGVVGKTGFVGITLLCGVEKTLLQTVVQIGGSGYRLKSEDVDKVLSAAPQLQLRMRQYALLQGMQVAQIAACNRLHDLEQRFTRWLLTAEDRVGPEFEITQEHLAQMLGTGRASLSVVASRIRKTGIIEYSRGTMKIVDRAGLEALACECYDTIRRYQSDLKLPW